MRMSFFIDVSAVSVRRRCVYEKEMHVKTEYVRHADEGERKRRVRLALEATGTLTDYANNARNATSAEPQTVLIVFDTRLSRKASRFFVAEATEKQRILAELEGRGATFFLGDDTNAEMDPVAEAYKKALAFLDANELYLAPGTDDKVLTTADFEAKGSK